MLSPHRGWRLSRRCCCCWCRRRRRRRRCRCCCRCRRRCCCCCCCCCCRRSRRHVAKGPATGPVLGWKNQIHLLLLFEITADCRTIAQKTISNDFQKDHKRWYESVSKHFVLKSVQMSVPSFTWRRRWRTIRLRSWCTSSRIAGIENTGEGSACDGRKREPRVSRGRRPPP